MAGLDLKDGFNLSIFKEASMMISIPVRIHVTKYEKLLSNPPLKV
jgi:hypothetical protein